MKKEEVHGGEKADWPEQKGRTGTKSGGKNLSHAICGKKRHSSQKKGIAAFFPEGGCTSRGGGGRRISSLEPERKEVPLQQGKGPRRMESGGRHGISGEEGRIVDLFPEKG